MESPEIQGRVPLEKEKPDRGMSDFSYAEGRMRSSGLDASAVVALSHEASSRVDDSGIEITLKPRPESPVNPSW